MEPKLPLGFGTADGMVLQTQLMALYSPSIKAYPASSVM